MLHITRYENDKGITIEIPGHEKILVKVSRIMGKQVMLSFASGTDVLINRTELADRKRRNPQPPKSTVNKFKKVLGLGKKE